MKIMKSQEILPKEERVSDKNIQKFQIETDNNFTNISVHRQLLIKYHKALEAAEEEINLLQNQYKVFTDKVINDRIKLDADERYNKAYDYLIDNDKYVLEGKATTLQDLKKALKIAAYGNKTT